MLEAPRDEPRGNQRMRIDIAQADRLAVVIDDRRTLRRAPNPVSGERFGRPPQSSQNTHKGGRRRSRARAFAGVSETERRVGDFRPTCGRHVPRGACILIDRVTAGAMLRHNGRA